MRALGILLAALVYFALPAEAQQLPMPFKTCSVSTLPTCIGGSEPGRIAVVIDAQDIGDCSLGGGTTVTHCRLKGDGTFEAVDGSTGVGAGDITTVGDCTTGACFEGAGAEIKLTSTDRFDIQLDSDNNALVNFRLLDGVGAVFLQCSEAGACDISNSLSSAAFSNRAGGDNADAGILRLSNTDTVCWEAAPAGTDVCVAVNASELLAISGGGFSVDGVDAGAGTTRTNASKIQIASHDTDCTSLTDGVRGETCFEEDSDKLFVCEPTAGGCDTAGEWIEVTSAAAPGGDACVRLTADQITCRATNGCQPETVIGSGLDYVTANFATDADDIGTFVFPVPTGFTGNTASVKLAWTSPDVDCDGDIIAPQDDVCWLVDGDSVADDQVWGTPAQLGANVGSLRDFCLAADDLMVITATGFVHDMLDEEVGVLRVTRDVAGGCGNDDDFIPAAKLVAVTICPE